MTKNERTINMPINRTIYLTGRITCDSINNIIRSINEIRESDLNLLDEYKSLGIVYKPNPILMYINSVGGDVLHTFGLIPLMGETKGTKYIRTPVDTFCLGLAASMAFVIFLCGRKRYCTPLSKFMMHSANTFTMGDLIDIRTEAEQMEEIQNTINQIIIANSIVTAELLSEKIAKKHNWWINVDEAIKLEMITGVLT